MYIQLLSQNNIDICIYNYVSIHRIDSNEYATQVSQSNKDNNDKDEGYLTHLPISLPISSPEGKHVNPISFIEYKIKLACNTDGNAYLSSPCRPVSPNAYIV